MYRYGLSVIDTECNRMYQQAPLQQQHTLDFGTDIYDYFMLLKSFVQIGALKRAGENVRSSRSRSHIFRESHAPC
jgi:hypothetical protein